jgi:hypothetical protein
MMHERYLAAVLCCAALAAAACGSSNTGTTRATTKGAVSPGVFRADVNALCQSAKTASGANLGKAAAALSHSLPQFEAIKPPPADQAAYATFLSHLRSLVTAVKNRDLAAAQAEAGRLGAVARKLHVSGCIL